jgi:hypothetical protein
MEPEEVWINARTNVATKLAIKTNTKKEGIPVKELVPEEYHKYLDIFDEEKANQFPEEWPWDHERRIRTKIVQKLQSDTRRTNRTRQISDGKP